MTSYVVVSCVRQLSDQAMLRIDKDSNGYASTLRLCGRIQSGRIACIRAAMTEGCAPKILDLSEVTLVDVAVVHFLMTCEDSGIELLQCPAYVREWILR